MLGRGKELQTLRQQKQEEEMRLTEVQNKYRAEKKIPRRYKVLADGKEQHFEQKWQSLLVGLEDLLQLLQAKIQAAHAEGAVRNSAAIKDLDKAIQVLRGGILKHTPS